MVPRGAIRIEVPSTPQLEDHSCGAAVVLAVSRHARVGPRTERAVVRDMGFDRAGSDPAHLRRALDRYGLAYTEHRGMTDAELRGCLDRRHPVIVMLQAWGDRRSYRHHWADGHWVVAIGHDREGAYFADPMLEQARGFLRWRELAERWHDVEGRARRRAHRYGLVIVTRRAVARASGTRSVRSVRIA